MSVKKGEIYEGMVQEVLFPNKGVTEAEGRQVIVKNTVPGQKIRFQVNKIRKGKCEARLLEVLEKSPAEIEPCCPHFSDCGGCTWQNLPYEEQLKMKETQVRRLLDEVCPEYLFEGIKPSPRQFGYRNKMEFSFGDEVKDGPLALGMHKRGSFYDIVTVDQCQIVDSDFRQILCCVLEFARAQGWTFYHKMRHEGYLRHLLVRKAVRTGEILIDLVTSTEKTCQSRSQELVDALLSLPLSGKIAGILHTANDSVADIVQDDGTQILWGQDYFYEELLGLRFQITPFSFFQTNSLGAEVLYDTVRSYVGDTKDKVIFDLYSGTGTIAQILAPVAKKVVGVEIVEEAVEAAKVNAKMNGLGNCEFIAGDVLKVIDRLTEKPDLIVLDPPRDGIHPKALRKIIDFQVENLVYISCKPTSLARDLVVLQESGYQVERVSCTDLFPGTVHVEVVCCLHRVNSLKC
ncbi:MAG: 23S rRNA (uracil(1939)-C(5))-methyltransferase RlmD [Candidatus Limivivens sp.]|nr:23S rRNA (uracil(1939)-C(5))-methyltransferase RlmD [Candidatus Limivivens sp.]